MTEAGEFSIVSLNSSERKGTVKTPVGFLDLVVGMGAAGDAHAGPGKRQLSLLGAEDIEAFRARGSKSGRATSPRTSRLAASTSPPCPSGRA